MSFKNSSQDYHTLLVGKTKQHTMLFLPQCKPELQHRLFSCRFQCSLLRRQEMQQFWQKIGHILCVAIKVCILKLKLIKWRELHFHPEVSTITSWYSSHKKNKKQKTKNKKKQEILSDLEISFGQLNNRKLNRVSEIALKYIHIYMYIYEESY